MRAVFGLHEPDAVINLAQKVMSTDRSLAHLRSYKPISWGPTRCWRRAPLWESLPQSRCDRFRLLHVSTDEVYGSLGAEGLFSENTPYDSAISLFIEQSRV